MAAVVRETESKFEVPADFAVPDLVGAGPVTEVSAPERSVLVAVYYDTYDLRLVRDGLTLRRREGGGDAGWHLKLPVKGSASRDELRLPLDAGPLGDVPAELTDLVTAYTRGAPLRAVATLRTEREVRLLGVDGTPVAELALDSVTVLRDSGGTGTTTTGSFRELELEDLEPADLRAVVQRLVDAGAEARALVPKVARALGPAAGAAPDVPTPPRHVTRSAPAADLVRAHVATQVRAIRAADVGVRRGEDDAVHQLRVSARRLRSGLRVFRPLLDRAWADDLRAELAWLAGELGGARDGEVLSARLEAAVDALPAEVDGAATRSFVTRHLDQGVADAQDEALAALRSDRYPVLLDRLVGAATQPRTTDAAGEPCAVVLPPLVASAWKRLSHEVRLLDVDGPDEPWHEARKRAKAVRYAAEAVAPALGKPAKRFARQVERVTENLGEHQDAAVAATALTRLAGIPRTGARVAFGLGVLYAAQRDDVHAAREHVTHAWTGVSRRRHRRWLRT